MTQLAVTWWGHSAVTVELGGARIVTDPLFTRRLFHLRRSDPRPAIGAAAAADVVVVSHLHHDHLHLPSLRAFGPQVPIVVPRGACAAVPGLRGLRLVEMSPGERCIVGGVEIEALTAQHDGRRHAYARRSAPALGYTMTVEGTRCWYPGDTGWHATITDTAPVDLALVPIGGWGPTLGEGHLDPEEAARVVDQIGATYSLPVHYGTFWPVGLRIASPHSYRHLFESPPSRFLEASRKVGTTVVLTPTFGERLVLDTTSMGET